MNNSQQPWIYSKWMDSLFIIMPPFGVLAFLVLLNQLGWDLTTVTPVVWIIIVLGIDVSHVYSTLFRTYFDKGAREKYKSVFLLVPLFCLITGILLHSINSMLFWRCLAYLAVFHFIRQQYGFMRLYSRQEQTSPWKIKLDTIAIYSTMLYPLVYWHYSGDRKFTWFIDGDFMLAERLESILFISLVIYAIIMTAFIISEIQVSIKNKFVNLPKTALITGTALSWYFGIVFYNGDLTFTALNVIAHGVPYMALVWIFGKKQADKSADTGKWQKIVFRPQSLIAYLIPLLFLAYLEEGMWDAIVWRDHGQFFNAFYLIPCITEKHWLSIIVPLLSLPQMTHYVLDGFIWRLSKKEFKAEMRI
jgi:hypothetical protein